MKRMNNMKKGNKKFFILFAIVGLALLMGCAIFFYNKIDDNAFEESNTEDIIITDKEYVNYLNSSERTMAFVVEEPHGGFSIGSGGWGYCYFSCFVSNNSMTVYCTSLDSTADSGRTVKYGIEIDDKTYNKLLNLCISISSRNENKLYKQVLALIENHDGELVSRGNDDDDARTEDGSFMWQLEFESLYK